LLALVFFFVFFALFEKSSQQKSDSPVFFFSMAHQFSLPARVSTWLFVSFFYALLFSPALFHLQQPTTIPALAKAGLAMSAAGLTLESQADTAKSLFKKQNADTFMK
jgi:hypothetical protein